MRRTLPMVLSVFLGFSSLARAEDHPAPADTALVEEGPTPWFARHRFGYLIGGGLLVSGLALVQVAQGEAKIAETISNARRASQALETARASAASANVMYGVAAVTLALTVLLEFLPPSFMERASLTFHF